MRKFILKAALAVAAASVLALSGVATAQATTLYDNINYTAFMWSGTSSSGGLPVGWNDKTSSFRNSGIETYCENWNCGGRTLAWSGDANDLRSVTNGLGLGENWSDRISSVS